MLADTQRLDRSPRQKRSRATAERLLLATLKILMTDGLEAAVVPRIAAAANVAAASIYRRFVDKEALLRAAFLHALRLANESNRRLAEKRLLRENLAASARRFVTLLFDQYRRYPHLTRALSRFIDADTDEAFVRQARAIMRANGDVAVDILLRHRDEITHTDPRRALQFAVLQVACSIEVFALDPNSVWYVEKPFPKKELAEHLAMSFIAYLTIERSATD